MNTSGLGMTNVQLQYQLLTPAADVANTGTQRQDFAAITTTTAKPASQHAPQQQDETSKQQQAFLTQLMDQMLANRIGLDKQKLDEIKAKIEEAQAEKAALQQQPQSPQRDGQIVAIDAKLNKLDKALQGLLEQAHRNREEHEREKNSLKAVQQYQLTAQADKPTLLL